MIHLDYRDARSIYNQVFDAFRDHIENGILLPGEKLPSVRELAASLAINPNTIQRAYRELESRGYIASVPGKGSFVCEIGEQDPQDGLLAQFDTVTAQLLSSGFTAEELAERIMQNSMSETRRNENA